MVPRSSHGPAIMRLEESLAHRLERDVRLLLYLKDRDARGRDAILGSPQRRGSQSRANRCQGER
jgi:hypothetical protein